MDGADALRSQQPAYSGRYHELRLSAIRQPAQCGKVQMIVMIVADCIDAWKILPANARLSAAARADSA